MARAWPSPVYSQEPEHTLQHRVIPPVARITDFAENAWNSPSTRV